VAIIAVFAASRPLGLVKRAEDVAAKRQMAAIREALVGREWGYVDDMRGIPGFSLSYLRIANLLVSTNLYGEVDAGELMRGFRIDVPGLAVPGVAKASEFTGWSEERRRGWRGPYLKSHTGEFPHPRSRRWPGDGTFGERGFFPEISGLRLPEAFSQDDASAYGFPGEPAVIDPWGNPYVLQIPPAQAFSAVSATNVSCELRFGYARVVSAGPDGILATPCFAVNETNEWSAVGVNWADERMRRLSRQAGLIDGGDRSRRGDDIVLFLSRNDIDEGEKR
jgi:hypothetical protein